VRFVQVLNNGHPGIQHGALVNRASRALQSDRSACAALIKDLKQRGLLTPRLSIGWRKWVASPCCRMTPAATNGDVTTTPTASASGSLAADSRQAYVHGETDEWSHHAVKDIVHHYDWHRHAAPLLRPRSPQARLQAQWDLRYAHGRSEAPGSFNRSSANISLAKAVRKGLRTRSVWR
jgi:hypothetical protein